MTKLIISIAMAIFCFAQPAFSQKIFNTVLNDSKKVFQDPKSNPTVAKIAQFKYVGLQYIREKAFKSDKDVTAEFLDSQAMSMNQFISLFIQDALINTQISKAEKKKRIMLFIDASGSNPLFEDNDKEVSDAYVTAANQLTPFSLNTNWQKALLAVKSQLKIKD